MAIPAAAVIVPLGLIFFFSGLIVNAIQATFFVLVRPFSKNTYRRINRWVAELLWLELVWLVDWWARVKIQVFTDSETFQQLGKICICLVQKDQGLDATKASYKRLYISNMEAVHKVTTSQAEEPKLLLSQK